MQIQQEAVDSIHASAREAFRCLTKWEVKTEQARAARQTAICAVTKIMKRIEAAELKHAAAGLSFNSAETTTAA
ncbi:MAG: hypothetical protein RBT11_01760 [Desulfobacterales bacterium]|jgi:hypothetical protein|nr:hypothetical protein [Desulfobacterales bacterium]